MDLGIDDIIPLLNSDDLEGVKLGCALFNNNISFKNYSTLPSWKTKLDTTKWRSKFAVELVRKDVEALYLKLDDKEKINPYTIWWI